MRLNRPDGGHEAVHLDHVGGLIPGRSGHLLWIGAVSLPLSGLSDLHVEYVLLRVQVAQLLGQPRLMHRGEVPSRDQASLLCLA